MVGTNGVMLACLVASIGLQLAAAALALGMIGITRTRKAWIFISLGISLMSVRRLIALSALLSGGDRFPLGYELVGLLTSLLMLVGMVLIRPIFASMNAALAEREKLIASLQESVAKVKLLSGFIPICATCKKIRDDRGFWRQIESYIRDHSEAEFTHGICPECAREWISPLGPHSPVA